MGVSRKQRRLKRKSRLIHSIYISIDPEGVRPDIVWLTFNAMDPYPHSNVTKLTVQFWTTQGGGEAYVSRNFPGITYKKTRLP